MESTEILGTIQLNELYRRIQSEIDKIKKTQVWVAVCGLSGSGKSSLINAIRGIGNANDSRWAPTGSKETTKKPTSYSHPDNHQIVFWDLPGVGTRNFPKEEYEKKVSLSDYDVYIIVSHTRFTEYEEWLANIITGYNKKFFFVRTMFDKDNESRTIDYPGKTENQLIEEIRKDAMFYHTHYNFVYIISNRRQYRENWDFHKLCDDILGNLSEDKKQTMIMNFRTTSKDMIQKKYEVMNWRIKYYAALSCAAACVPLPGLSIAVDISLIMSMAKEFQNGFGLTEDHVKDWGNFVVTTTMKNILVATSALVTSEALINLLKQQVAALTVEEISRFIPIFGTVIAGGISYCCTYHLGIILLDKMKTAAEELALALVDSFKQTEF